MSLPTVYTRFAASMHWMVGVPLIGCVGTVIKAQQSPKEEKGKWMFRHKSLGLLTGILVVPRVAMRLMNSSKYNLSKIEGTSGLEELAAKITHYGLYGFMTIMPASGIAMGYYGGKGLPFFYTTLPGASEKNGKIAGNSFKLHKQLGIYGKYFVPLHVGGALQHWFRGHTIFARVNPFRGPSPPM
mmetsp:Transcript_30744/g.43641  ORF Transcript_30744/g.43641 Transcript_30744/m.43641 type:complete len:185 (-) Transcript_30744:129-683(-)|eukprot:CAMPEP_0202447918 /NCGR_PEP_ID=MMETSP1360-20130828/6694_1 /ASSEMBLY_ACC=CAM_ASM_000848 /TAXON_ID=515479 /ORGANISM="Licmophora paradoxa, Strain CCMP2313" /LENGTH=184 /DNA_ID=CAMNT_0049065229 /DNA_START=47 /DNA_END=601 /DNA_ORIENTATION=-